ncbi:hypothetical protein [Haloimpatiens massiliensis]|uniref:hypothetical protein n=1 Tax=Haloimpatiens massiliensis TaxID=1658110 RepID=UPI000C81B315|nr:hypothetical protein [Haloimpatiens massiliensis]
MINNLKLEKIKTELEKYSKLKLNIKEEKRGNIDFLTENKELFTTVNVDNLEENQKFIIEFKLNKVSKFFKLNSYKINTNYPCDVDIRHKILNKSLDEIFKEYKFDIIEDEYFSSYYTKVKLKFDKNLNIIDELHEIKHFYISNEGGEDIYFYEKEGKIFEKETRKEIKGLLDVGGQFCCRLIPILL